MSNSLQFAYFTPGWGRPLGRILVRRLGPVRAWRCILGWLTSPALWLAIYSGRRSGNLLPEFLAYLAVRMPEPSGRGLVAELEFEGARAGVWFPPRIGLN